MTAGDCLPTGLSRTNEELGFSGGAERRSILYTDGCKCPTALPRSCDGSFAAENGIWGGWTVAVTSTGVGSVVHKPVVTMD
jgi:hypothetical protein